MTNLTLVTEARLYPKDNPALYAYFDQVTLLFNFLVRRTIHHLRKNLHGEKESVYRTKLMQEFNLSNRMAKAIIRTAKNHLKLHKEAMTYAYKKLGKKQQQLFRKITTCKNKLNQSRLTKKQKNTIKIQLFWLQMRLNKTKQLRANGIPFQLTFGSKKLLQTNRQKFFQKRDNQIAYIGDKNETAGNQQFQLIFNTRFNRFDYKLRYDHNWIVDKQKYLFGSFVVKNKDAKDCIRAILNHPKSAPLTYRIIRKSIYLYIQVMYRKEIQLLTRDTHGV